MLERYTGSTQVEKNVRYYLPANMRGVVLMSHGTGGSSSFIEKPEAYSVAIALVKNGYGVIATEAEEAAAGDLNGNKAIRWSSLLSKENTDLKNIEILFKGLEDRGLVKSDTPKYALGMSNGGHFSVSLGGVSASNVATDYPHLRFKAVVSYCADATSLAVQISKTPTEWLMCGNDDQPEVSNEEAKANHDSFKARGVPSEFFVHQATPLYDERFARVPEITTEVSRAIAKEFRAAGFVDEAGFFIKTTNEIYASMSDPNNQDKFRSVLALPVTAKLSLKDQIQVMRAEHEMYSDFSQKTLDFFEKFISQSN